MASFVTRVARSDAETPVLLNITAGSRQELDIQIEGTEGTRPFFANFKHYRLSKLLQKNSNLTDDEWDTVLKCSLLQKRPQTSGERDLLANVELSAHVAPDQLVLTFRKNISGIRQRIAEIPLPQDDEHELDTVAWVSTAAERSRLLEAEFQAASAERDAQRAANGELQKQLEELVQAKIDHENDLLARFTRLLNTKKLKIRNLYRLLSSNEKGTGSGKLPASDEDEDEDEPMQDLPPGRRSTKRKSTHEPRSKLGKSALGGGDDTDGISTESDRRTPDRSDEEAATEDEDDLEAERSLPDGQKVPGVQPTKPSFISTLGSTNESSGSVPPRRALPFAASRKASIDSGRETKSTVTEKGKHDDSSLQNNASTSYSAYSDEEL